MPAAPPVRTTPSRRSIRSSPPTRRTTSRSAARSPTPRRSAAATARPEPSPSSSTVRTTTCARAPRSSPARIARSSTEARPRPHSPRLRPASIAGSPRTTAMSTTTPSAACATTLNENVNVIKTNPTIATVLKGANGASGTHITVPLGTAVHDTSTLTGATADAGGTVQYRVFTNANCTALKSDGNAGRSPSPTASPATRSASRSTRPGPSTGRPSTAATPTTTAPRARATSRRSPSTRRSRRSRRTRRTRSRSVARSVTPRPSPAGPARTARSPSTCTTRLHCSGEPIFSDSVDVNGNGDYASRSVHHDPRGHLPLDRDLLR